MNHFSSLRMPLVAALLAGIPIAPARAQDRFTDPRDGYAYPVVVIGSAGWFAENLRHRSADSRCYEDDEANCADHGRLYRLPDAERVCPEGWRLKFGGDTGFNVRYSGWIDPHRADSSRAMGRNAAYWASTAGPPDDVSATAWHRDVATSRNTIWRSPVNVTYWLSVRCVGEPTPGRGH